MATTDQATARASAVIRLPRARLVLTSGASHEGQAPVEEVGGGDRVSQRARCDAAPYACQPLNVALPLWAYDPNGVAQRARQRTAAPPGGASWRALGLVLSDLVALLDSGPTPQADRAAATLDTVRALLTDGSLPPPTVLGEPHDFLITRCYFGTPTSGPCADLLLHCASDLAVALESGRDPYGLADLLLDTGVTLDAYVAASRALARAHATAHAPQPRGGAAS